VCWCGWQRQWATDHQYHNDAHQRPYETIRRASEQLNGTATIAEPVCTHAERTCRCDEGLCWRAGSEQGGRKLLRTRATCSDRLDGAEPARNMLLVVVPMQRWWLRRLRWSGNRSVPPLKACDSSARRTPFRCSPSAAPPGASGSALHAHACDGAVRGGWRDSDGLCQGRR
jgi:hypothetical protein